jgi:dihydrofolate reductase
VFLNIRSTRLSISPSLFRRDREGSTSEATLSKLKVSAFSVSIDGYGAGPDQSLQNPLGVGGEALHEWAFPTRTFQRMFGNASGTLGVDEDFAARSFANMGAWILGRNMFGPVRGPWPDDEWKGWWGDEPPYHVPVFVLTHHPRAPIEMKGGTTFHFVTGGIHAALERAREAAAGKDVRIGGGVQTVREYLRANLIDEMHLAISPVLLGRGEALFADIDLTALGFRRTEHMASANAMHVVLTRDRT